MAKIQLVNSGVTFLEEPHEYWLTLPNGEKKQLFGITKAIQRQVAGTEYDGCPEYLIKRAGEYGSSVHKSIERLINEFDHDGTVETEDFRNLTADMNIEASEYNVTDGDYYASNIDLVTRLSDTEFSLFDIKTYSNAKLTKAQMAKVRYQLSCYAYMFELQNPGARVIELSVIHICNKTKKDGTVNHIAELVPIERIPTEICKALLEADRNGIQFNNPYELPKDVEKKCKRIIKLIQTKKEVEEELNFIKKDILETMLFLDVKNWKGDNISFTRLEDTQRNSFDLAAFKKAYPDLPYESYIKTSKVAGSLKIAI
ncbi:MAG: PD-(D/E)XK nuclease family protein [Bacteroidaceae bacterium]|nr:PD-(D/E)XK nuclease family protein [Bacteroidaceae bacterium]